MEDNKQRIKSVTIDLNQSLFQDMDEFISVELNGGDHVTIKGWKYKGMATITYEMLRSNAIEAGILREEYEQ